MCMKRTNDENNEEGIFACGPFRVCIQTLNCNFLSTFTFGTFLSEEEQSNGERERDAREEEEEEGDKRETL